MKLRLLSSVLFLATAAFAQYKAEPAGPLPAAVPGTYKQVISSDGNRVTGPNGPVLDIWFVKKLPSGADVTADPVTFKHVPQGALVAIFQFPTDGQDRRGQKIAAGVYTARHSLFPVNGDHQGVSPQRDFLLLTPIADDPDPAATPDFETLVKMSKKSSGTPHPAVFSYWKEEAKYFDGGMVDFGEGEWLLQVKVGDVPVSVMVVGVYRS